MTAGWATVPEDLQGAVGQLVAWSLAIDRRRGQASVSAGGTSTSYRDEKWPDDVLAVLRSYMTPPRAAVRPA